MNYSRAFSFFSEDKNWLSKILIAGLISLIPVVGQFYLFGWMIEIVRRTKAGRRDILPTTHFTYFLVLGLKYFVVCLIYAIPVFLLSLIMNLITSAAGHSDSGAASAFLAGFSCIFGLITFVVDIAIALLGTYGAIKLAETDQIKACLDFSDAFNTIKNNLSVFIIVELLALVAGIIQSAGLILCFIGVIFTMPYGTAVVGNLVGQLWGNLKPFGGPSRPFRGSAVEKTEDIIEEAPFTKVRDIEEKSVNEAAEEAEDIRDQVISVMEPVIPDNTPEAEPEPEAPAAEEPAVEEPQAEPEPEAPAAEEPAVEEPQAEPEPEAPAAEEPAPEEPQAEPEPEEKDQDTDIPSFE